MSQLQYWLTKCAPTSDLVTLVLTLPRALRDVEHLSDPAHHEPARLAVRAFSDKWRQTASDRELAKQRALVEAFASDAITRLDGREAWSHNFAEQLRAVAEAFDGTTTATWARDAADNLQQSGVAVHRHGPEGDSGSSAA